MNKRELELYLDRQVRKALEERIHLNRVKRNRIKANSVQVIETSSSSGKPTRYKLKKGR